MLIGNLEVIDLRESLPAPGYPAREPWQIHRIVVHHDAGPFASLDEHAELARIQQVHHQHQDVNGWPGIGYHLYVFPSGRVYYVGDLQTVRYHTAGPDNPDTPLPVSVYNEDGVAIVLAGEFTEDTPPEAQLAAARAAVANLQLAYGQFFPVWGHRELSQTDCPGDTWWDWKPQVTVTPDSPGQDLPPPPGPGPSPLPPAEPGAVGCAAQLLPVLTLIAADLAFLVKAVEHFTGLRR